MNIIEKDSLQVKVENALETIRPFLKDDGGDVELISIDSDMKVQIKLLGNCRDCNMSVMTMKAGIEEAIRRAVPEIIAVEAIK
jgi:Fe-S cluster biogenesis protein NfuA